LEFPGGVRGEYEVKLPAVLGIQAAEKPPRYVPVAKVRAAKHCRGTKTCGFEYSGDLPWDAITSFW
jgi:electron transfer flavoprotein alpha/beta subunit